MGMRVTCIGPLLVCSPWITFAFSSRAAELTGSSSLRQTPTIALFGAESQKHIDMPRRFAVERLEADPAFEMEMIVQQLADLLSVVATRGV